MVTCITDDTHHLDAARSALDAAGHPASAARYIAARPLEVVDKLADGAYDLVVSSSSAWAHGVLVDEGAVHVSYCHNPFRYAWNEREATLAARMPGVRTALRVLPEGGAR